MGPAARMVMVDSLVSKLNAAACFPYPSDLKSQRPRVRENAGPNCSSGHGML
jgi:hypothetical protein